jgi:hypothetical protein
MAQQKDYSHHNQQEKGACSPLFACNNCGPSAEINYNRLELVPSNPVVPVHQSFYLLQLSSYTASFFQPPRIA